MTAHAKNSSRQAAPKFSLVFIHMAEDSLTIYIADTLPAHIWQLCSVLHTSAYQKQGLLFVTAHAKNSRRQAAPKFSLVFIHMAEDSLHNLHCCHTLPAHIWQLCSVLHTSAYQKQGLFICDSSCQAVSTLPVSVTAGKRGSH